MLEQAGHAAYAVGGCVRNALFGAPVADVDIATDARPDTVVALAVAAGLKPVPTGIDHGTVTVVAEGIGHEVTTFRADVETDGRRAVVRYSDDIAEDAARRDFTMNALYADARGAVLDPLNGLPDLEARRVRFIRDAGERIREDYLRILRFFRFHAWYGDAQAGVDPEALAGIADNLDGLEALSAERVGHEITRLLSAPDPAPSVAVMEQVGVLARVLPGATSRMLAPLVALEESAGLAPDPMRRLAVMGYFDARSLRLSKARQKHLEAYQSLLSANTGYAEIAYRHGEAMARDVAALRGASLGQPMPDDLEAQIAAGAGAKLPIRPRDLMPDFEGPALGEALRERERRWIASGFTLTKADLLK
ncbi:CCA tRNA nucleotidyltransferase [Salipiger bermudensis]|uniref:CCA tRNA nucleotidyltransferase n=1 Tax=Salipiger bermudensis TaxID=344736 RepID=UPI001C992437|nr:CCA tRNA nucleotidyltransferase [Salipiger bermudensis]MBY6003970.1 CCA tRNA nucleotidyltransferase [Salipiger bermudensis]